MWFSKELAKPKPSEETFSYYFEVTVANADFHKSCQYSKKMLAVTNAHFVGKCCTLDIACEETLVE